MYVNQKHPYSTPNICELKSAIFDSLCMWTKNIHFQLLMYINNFFFFYPFSFLIYVNRK